MKTIQTKSLILGVTVVWFGAFPVLNSAESVSTLSATTNQTKDEERLLPIGRKLFVGRCASCHNENGDKPLSIGLPLNQRQLSRETIEKNVAGRLSTATDEQKLAVTLYIQSFMNSQKE